MFVFILLSVVFVFVVCFSLKFYFHITKGICTSNVDLTGKIIVITGGNTGIGKEYVLDMARRNAKIIMACRNVTTANECARWITEQTNNNQIEVEYCNLNSMKTVSEFCQRLKKKVSRIDFLVCFAAATGVPADQLFTPDGFEMHFQCNYLSHYLMVYLLQDLFSSHARIILTSSSAHLFGSIDPDNISKLEHYRKHPFRSYGDSKLALVMFAKDLSEQFAHTNITANSFHPGTVYTNGIKHNQIWYLRIILSIIAFFYDKSAKDGAQTMIYLTVSDKVANISGEYFADCAIAPYNRLADDRQLRKKLFKLSNDLIKSYLE